MGSNVVGAKIANVPATQHEARIQKRNAHEHKRKVQKQASKRDSHVQAKKDVKKQASNASAQKPVANISAQSLAEQDNDPRLNPDAKVAIISCCFGTIEGRTKPVVEQSVPCDKFFFTDNPNFENAGDWIIDTTPYHLMKEYNDFLDTDYTNSWKNNQHPYIICKYYKANFHKIPRLQKYDYVLMLDATMEITNKDCIKMLIE